MTHINVTGRHAICRQRRAFGLPGVQEHRPRRQPGEKPVGVDLPTAEQPTHVTQRADSAIVRPNFGDGTAQHLPEQAGPARKHSLSRKRFFEQTREPMSWRTMHQVRQLSRLIWFFWVLRLFRTYPACRISPPPLVRLHQTRCFSRSVWWFFRQSQTRFPDLSNF